jgi:hypothetical protein
MRSVITVVFVSTMATACVTDPTDPDASTRTQGVLEDNKITTNKITTNQLALNKITTNKITTNKITTNGIELNKITTNGLISTEDGRDVLSYVISCAIPSGVTLYGEHEGVVYQFPGDIGLAPRWLDRSIDETDQRWVSACMIARVNLYGTPVPLSIRGPHTALKVNEAEARDYSAEEGAFYGNIFTPAGEPIIWNACRGRAQATGEGGGLQLRECAEPDPANPGFTMCGFVYAGDCADWTQPVNTYACQKFRQPVERNVRDDDDVLNSRDYHGGYYERCHDSQGFGRWQGAERYTETITVFVAP